MGVKYLWNIIDDARSIKTLECLRGKTISVDLSIWIVEANQTLQFKSSIKKPHLRNMFFRILFLRRLGVKLIFVTEGDPPDLKQNVMKKRAMNKYGTKVKIKGKIGRSRFQRTIDECTRMLDLIGIPHIRAHGEAEQMCATLNKHGLTDGCLTNDGDFFLYGGKTIYRDFGINPKDQSVLVYTSENIKKEAGISRNDMIGLALLNGCDYTEGLNGVGIRTVKKFLEERDFLEDLLVRFQQWGENGYQDSQYNSSEALIIRKAKKAECFWNEKVVDEFLVQRDRLDGIQKKMKFKYPHIKDLQKYLLDQLEWPDDYTLPKILQLATSTYLEKLFDNTFFPVPIQPVRIVKTRCQMNVLLVDVAWEKSVDEDMTYSGSWENCSEEFVTLENQQVVSKMLPRLVEEYVASKESKKKGSRKKKPTKDTNQADAPVVDTLSTLNTNSNNACLAAKLVDTFEMHSKSDENDACIPKYGKSQEPRCKSISAVVNDTLLSKLHQSEEAILIDEMLREPFVESQFDAGDSLLTMLHGNEAGDHESEAVDHESDESSDGECSLMPSLSERLSKIRLTKSNTTKSGVRQYHIDSQTNHTIVESNPPKLTLGQSVVLVQKELSDTSITSKKQISSESRSGETSDISMKEMSFLECRPVLKKSPDTDECSMGLGALERKPDDCTGNSTELPQIGSNSISSSMENSTKTLCENMRDTVTTNNENRMSMRLIQEVGVAKKQESSCQVSRLLKAGTTTGNRNTTPLSKKRGCATNEQDYHRISTPLKGDLSSVTKQLETNCSFFTPGSDSIFLEALDGVETETDAANDDGSCGNYFQTKDEDVVVDLDLAVSTPSCFNAVVTPICVDITTPNFLSECSATLATKYRTAKEPNPLKDITNSHSRKTDISSAKSFEQYTPSRHNSHSLVTCLTNSPKEQSVNTTKLSSVIVSRDDYENELRRRLNLSNENADPVFNDSVSEEPEAAFENSPICLAERLKMRHR